MSESSGAAVRLWVCPADPQALAVVDTDAAHLTVVPWLDEATTRRARDVADVLHLHLGLPAPDPVTDPAAVAGVVAGGDPTLVLTLHDLASIDDDVLDVLVPAASVVLVAHPFAAAEVRRRWDRTAVLTSLPPVLDAVRPPSLRPATDPVPLRVGLLDGTTPLLRAVADRLLHPVEPVPHAHVVRPGEVRAWLAALDVLVLSSSVRGRGAWIECSRDLGFALVLPVAAAEVDPRPQGTYVPSASADHVTRVVQRAATARPRARGVTERQRLLGSVRQQHAAVYDTVAGGARG